MEEVAVALVQAFLELFLETLVYIGLDVISIQTERRGSRGCLLLTLFALAGMALGGLITWVHPRAMLPLLWLRLANLVVGPALAGGASALLARYRGREPWSHFWPGFAFVLGYNLVRFAYARV